MADDIVPSPTAPGKKTLWQRVTSSRFLVISILFHVLLIVVAGVLVVQTITTKRKQNFAAAAPAPANRAVEHKIQMVKKQQSMSAPAPTKRIATTGLSKVALPEMPDVAAPIDVTSPMTTVNGASPGFGTGMSAGGGAEGGTGGGLPFFGLKDTKDSAFSGSLYDLKQNRSRQPTGMKLDGYVKAVKAFGEGDFSESLLKSYFKSRTVLYTPQIIMPSIRAEEGPKAFGVNKQVEPKEWVVLYQAKVSPKRSGTIHFVGAGDDAFLVSFNGKLVLDGCWKGPWTNWKAEKTYAYESRRIKSGGGPYPRGDAIKVEAGQWYDMKVLIGEGAGGFFDAVLLIEEDGVSYRKDSKGNPILPPFRLANVRVGALKKGESLLPYATSGPIWTTPGPPAKDSLLGR